MAKVLFSNNAVTSLAAYISATATTMTLATGTGALFPEIKSGSGDYFYVTLLDTSGRFEIVKVTARSADLCTIVRAQDKTNALAFPQGSTVEQRVTAASLNDIIDDVTKRIQAIPSSIYPIGSIYMSLNSADPATLFGGSWNKLEEGRVLIGANSKYTAGTSGGSFTHTLTTDELPAHSHTSSTASAGAHTHTRGTMNITGSFFGENPNQDYVYSGCFYQGSGKYPGIGDTDRDNASTMFDASRSWTGATSSNGAHTHAVTVSNTGGSKAHSIMQPYLAVHMWKRVA